MENTFIMLRKLKSFNQTNFDIIERKTGICNSGPLVSIIIPTKNSASTILCLLNSISKQKYPYTEVIIVDNFSSDKTREIALTWGATVLQVVSERSKARNLGARAAHGAYLLFLDSDMELTKKTITNCLHSIDSKYGACIIREITVGVGYWAKVRSLERKTYEGGTVSETAVFFKKDVFEEICGFNENLVGFEDYDLQVRLERKGINIGYSMTPIIHHEGKLILAKHLMKKMYYVRTGKKYLFENKKRSISQVLPVRYVYIKNRYVFKEKPLCLPGLFFLKTLEAVVGAIALFVDS